MRTIAPLIFGLVGTAILIGLGVWQLQRLDWKQGVIARLEERLAAHPVALPEDPDPAAHDFLRVAVPGTPGERALHVFTSLRGQGAGYRVIVPLETEGRRRILVDLGFVPEEMKDEVPLGGGPARVVGALYWPDEVDSFTPPPDRDARVWFARDLRSMAEALGTEQVLVIAEEHGLGEWPMPRRLGVGIVNNHLEYAITWFSLAAVWAVMSLLLFRTQRARTA